VTRWLGVLLDTKLSLHPSSLRPPSFDVFKEHIFADVAISKNLLDSALQLVRIEPALGLALDTNPVALLLGTVSYNSLRRMQPTTTAVSSVFRYGEHR